MKEEFMKPDPIAITVVNHLLGDVFFNMIALLNPFDP
jgi:hypothetical protein